MKRKKHQGVKRADSPLGIPNLHEECNGVQKQDNTSYI